MTVDDIQILIEGTANMLRGMTLDPHIPSHAKSAMQDKIQKLEEAADVIDSDGIE